MTQVNETSFNLKGRSVKGIEVSRTDRFIGVWVKPKDREDAKNLITLFEAENMFANTLPSGIMRVNYPLGHSKAFSKVKTWKRKYKDFNDLKFKYLVTGKL